jgi:predicted GNAT superfamily acetyltransferase
VTTTALPPRPAVCTPSQVVRMTEVPAELAEQFLRVYRAGFAPLELRSAARQALTDDEFRAEMRDPLVTKFVAFDDEGEAGAMAIIATDLSIVPWISVPYYAHHFPEHYARGAIYYVNAVVVRPDRQGGPWSKVVLEDMYRFVAEHRALMAFDCCGYNVDTVKLVETTARAAHRIAHVETAELDQQRYYAFDMAGGLR